LPWLFYKNWQIRLPKWLGFCRQLGGRLNRCPQDNVSEFASASPLPANGLRIVPALAALRQGSRSAPLAILLPVASTAVPVPPFGLIEPFGIRHGSPFGLTEPFGLRQGSLTAWKASRRLRNRLTGSVSVPAAALTPFGLT
jgi:hypothetical protein